MSAFLFEQLDTAAGVVTASFTPADRAAEIVAEAQARALEIERAAKESGYVAGRAEVIAHAEAEMAGARDAVLAAVDAVYAAQRDLAAAVELRAVELAIAIAERILGVSIELQPELVCNLVTGALRRTLTRDRLVLDVNPDDVEIVRGWLGAGAQEGADAIEVHAERRVARGGCVVRTSEGEIDAQLSEQLARAEEVLRQTLATPEGDEGT